MMPEQPEFTKCHACASLCWVKDMTPMGYQQPWEEVACRDPLSYDVKINEAWDDVEPLIARLIAHFPCNLEKVLRGFSVGGHGYGYTTAPQGESNYDKKGRLRADGFKLVIVPDEARVIQRIFRDFIACKAITKIAKDLNDESVPTKVRLKGGWNVSTVSRILKDEKYIGRFVWNRTTTAKDPLSGKIRQVERPKEDWVVQERSDIRIASDEGLEPRAAVSSGGQLPPNEPIDASPEAIH